MNSIQTPEILELDAQPTAFIHLVVTHVQMREVFGPTIGELMAALGAQGVQPTGQIFTHHLRRPTETFDFRLSVPVAQPVERAGRVEPGEWPAMRAARTVYAGPYEGLPDAWGGFMEWIEAQGHTPAPDLYESYRVGPESSADPAVWRTELTRPLIR